MAILDSCEESSLGIGQPADFLASRTSAPFLPWVQEGPGFLGQGNGPFDEMQSGGGNLENTCFEQPQIHPYAVVSPTQCA